MYIYTTSIGMAVSLCHIQAKLQKFSDDTSSYFNSHGYLYLFLVEVMGGCTKKRKQKYIIQRNRQEKMMENYMHGNIDLLTYQLSMGAISHQKGIEGSNQNTSLSGYEIEDADQDAENNVKSKSHCDPDKDLSDGEIDDDGCVESESLMSPKKVRKILRHKKQIPQKACTESFLKIRSPDEVSPTNDDSLKGDALRRKRLFKSPAATAALALAAAATATIVSISGTEDGPVFEDDQRQVNTSVRQHAHPAQEDEISRLQSLGFRVSASQPCTPADGDSYSLQIAANLLQRDIIVIPTRTESAHNPQGYMLIETNICLNEPIYMLYYEEWLYAAGHYQSIRKVIIYVKVCHFFWGGKPFLFCCTGLTSSCVE